MDARHVISFAHAWKSFREQRVHFLASGGKRTTTFYWLLIETRCEYWSGRWPSGPICLCPYDQSMFGAKWTFVNNDFLNCLISLNSFSRLLPMEVEKFVKLRVWHCSQRDVAYIVVFWSVVPMSTVPASDKFFLGIVSIHICTSFDRRHYSDSPRCGAL